jgi:hypothetical protein
MPKKSIVHQQLLISAKVKDVLSIRIPNYIKGYMQVEIINLNGKSIFSDIYDSSKQIIMDIRVSLFEEGQYFLKVMSETKQFSIISFEKV